MKTLVKVRLNRLQANKYKRDYKFKRLDYYSRTTNKSY